MRETNDLSRREFLGSTATALAVAGGMNLRVADPANAAETSPAPRPLPATIHVLYLAKPIPTWPRPDFKPQDDIQRIRPVLEAFEARPEPAVRFAGHELLRVPEDLSRVQGALKDADGLLVFNLTSTVMNLIEPLSESGLPLVLFSQPYSGHDWSQW